MSTKSHEEHAADAHRTHPGDPERDHTMAPDEHDPSESPLPEGAQPTQGATRLSVAVFVIAITVVLVAVIAAAIASQRWGSIGIGAVVGLALLIVGALPVAITYRLRVRDLENLNRQEQTRH